MNTQLRRVCLVWHYWNSLLSVAICIAGIACFLSAKSIIDMYSDCPTYSVMKPLSLAIWIISLANHVFLLTLDLLYTRTWVGTFLVQHLVFVIILSMSAAIMVILSADHSPDSFLLLVFNPKPGESSVLQEVGVISALVTAGLAIGPFVSLLYCFVSARREKGSQVGWLVNAKELISGDITDGYPLILGVKRSGRGVEWISSSVQTSAKAVVMFFWNMFFRRIPAVETMTYAFILNTFALLTIAAICVRASISLALAKDRDCRLRTRVDECFNQSITCQNARFATMYGSSTPNGDSYSLNIDVLKLHLNGTFQDSRTCSSTFEGPFKVFDCSAMCQINTPDSIIAFNVAMRSLNTSSLNISPILKVWFSDTDPTVADISDIGGRFAAPNLLTGWQLLPGYEWRAEIGLTKRKFILSSFFRDVIAGNSPDYLTVNLRPINTVGTLARTNGSVASGLVFPATQGSPAMMDTDLGLSDARSYVGCEVIEEYRDSSPFDILGSIGGLLALVQGIYLWLVGRPLLWGLTGAKAISPFGVIGTFSLPGFRKKLREHYRVPGSNNLRPITLEDEERIRMVAFLLDYVVDMGPAGIPAHYQQEIATRSAQVRQDAGLNAPAI